MAVSFLIFKKQNNNSIEKANELKVFYSEDGINYSEISEPLTVNEYSRIYLKAAADNSNWTKYVYYNTSNRMILLDPENYQWEENNRTYQGEFLEIESITAKECGLNSSTIFTDITGYH